MELLLLSINPVGVEDIGVITLLLTAIGYLFKRMRRLEREVAELRESNQRMGKDLAVVHTEYELQAEQWDTERRRLEERVGRYYAERESAIAQNAALMTRLREAGLEPGG